MLQVYTEPLEAWTSRIETLVSNRLDLVFTPSEEGWAIGPMPSLGWERVCTVSTATWNVILNSRIKMAKCHMCPRMITKGGKDSGRKASEEATGTLNRVMEESGWV